MDEKLQLNYREFQTVQQVSGPLLFVDLRNKGGVSYGEIVEIETVDGEKRNGQVLEVSQNLAVVQVFEGTRGLETDKTRVRFLGRTMEFGVSHEILGRVFSGRGITIDGGGPVAMEKILDINGAPINPSAREYPKEFIQTGISTIDTLLTLVRGQKLPLFSGSGLPHNRIAAQIARQAKVLGEEEDFAVVFCAMGLTADEARFFRDDFESTGALERTVLFLNLADDPAVERLLTPRIALTAAEYLAFEKGYQVLVILTDMTTYAEALREIGAARNEVPGRRGYPGYLYSDFATIYERAGKIRGKKGSITQIPILTMPNFDITHPVPDLTGYITEGQIYIDVGLNRKGLYPPINPLPSLSRLMKECIGINSTRSDHKYVADQLYALYADGRDLRDLVAVVGSESLSDLDRKTLQFADLFEEKFINQDYHEDRTIFESLDIGWELLSIFDDPERVLKRIPVEVIKKFHPRFRDTTIDYNRTDI
ncbi:MAG: V-type ATP synthase subunit B [Candidatus Heimdallarchaeum endolithica]|uniref:A-type ATP synthase subunit B n=1 Tax=Candidatus Heimdallarchaeum endolithica TaxID=2876572 RepID=A0A9Y1BNX5_9ARCH|nr:MAG: V-type ATP synthase subunit B [Candidatus Heimdallarchaeum endolithica]